MLARTSVFIEHEQILRVGKIIERSVRIGDISRVIKERYQYLADIGK
jgi:hypothetical protein